MVKLDRWQQAVADHRGGPAVCAAAPGSGKTATMVAHVVNLLREGVPPQKILVLTFSRSAVQTFRTRLAASGVQGARTVVVRTFHAQALQVLRHSGRQRQARLLSEWEARGLWHQALGPKTSSCPEAIGPVQLDVDELVGRVEQARVRGEHVGESADLDPIERAAARAFAAIKRRRGVVDFTDLIVDANDLLASNPEIAHRMAPQAMLVDEGQDTNRLQMHMVRALHEAAPESHLVLVGDARQAIYGFQGADPSAVTAFTRWFPAGRTFVLPVTYRLSPAVAGAANALAQMFADEMLREPIVTAGDERGWVGVVHHDGDEDEVAWTVRTAQTLSKRQDRPEVLIVARTNNDLAPVAVALRAAGVKFNQADPMAYWRLPEIDGLLDAFRLASNHDDVLAACRLAAWPASPRKNLDGLVQRVLAAGGPPTGYACLADDKATRMRYELLVQPAIDASATSSPFDLLHRIMANDVWKQLVPERMLERAQETIPTMYSSARLTPTVASLLHEAQSAVMADSTLNPDIPVTLATAHGAKGMEADVVIVLRCEAGRWPHARSTGPAEREEEIRLLYVAVTRARRVCVLSACPTRHPVSGFVQAIDVGYPLASVRAAEAAAWIDETLADRTSQQTATTASRTVG